jgi:transglutaminase-like putative cysteine protease
LKKIIEKIGMLSKQCCNVLILIGLIVIYSVETGRCAWKRKYDQIEFSYRWTTPKYQSEIKFRIPTKIVEESYSKIKPVEGSNAQKIAIMKETYVHDTNRKNNIRLELERFVHEDSEHLKPLANALIVSSPDKSPRGLVAHALSFVQSLPYSTTFRTRTTSLTPIGVLVENKGDCDSKSSLLVAILNGMGIKAILLDIPGHMMVGVDIPIESGEAYFEGADSKKYLIAETTIQNLPLGTWDDKHLGKPVRAIESYKPKPPKLQDE